VIELDPVVRSIAGSYKTFGYCPTDHEAVYELAPLVGFSILSAGTPGPNNILLWASGTEFGFRRTLPHVFGTAVGIGAMTLAVALGLGAVIGAFPPLAIAMKVAGTAYLLYLAWQVAGASALERADVARPLGFLQAAALQAINPKSWIFALGALTTFRPASLPAATGTLLVAATMMTVIVPTAAIWAAGGGLIGQLLSGDRARRAVSLVLAGLLVLTIVSVWI
jgi:threonine/homoserine/homoserine lactone efflux protein